MHKKILFHGTAFPDEIQKEFHNPDYISVQQIQERMTHMEFISLIHWHVSTYDSHSLNLFLVWECGCELKGLIK